MQLRILSALDVRTALPMSEAIEAARDAFTQIALGQSDIPLRVALKSLHGSLLCMPGHLTRDPALALKVVSIFPNNPAMGLPYISGLVLVFDTQTGQPRTLLDGATLTALRTGAATGLATDLLARPQSRIVVLFGAGAQAYDQVAGVRAVRPISEVRIRSLDGRHSEALAERLRAEGLEAHSVQDSKAALRGADIVLCATTSRTPLFADADVPDGAHINAIGAYTPEMQEVPPETVTRARVVVDDKESALAEAGDLLKPLAEGRVGPEIFETALGDVVLGRVAGRRSVEEITLFKSVGLAAQDVAAAARALERAEEEDIGTVVEI